MKCPICHRSKVEEGDHSECSAIIRLQVQVKELQKINTTLQEIHSTLKVIEIQTRKID